MVDSIGLRVHNLHKYTGLLNFLLTHCARNMYETSAKLNANPEQLFYNLKIVEYIREGKTMIQSNGEKLTSSHYTLAWNLPAGDKSEFVDFNFSIPKLLFGTNVLQFVHHKMEIRMLWDKLIATDYKSNQEATYDRLIYFIRIFFEKYFNVTNKTVEPSDIEVRRIDITWNQIFDTKKDAFEYLEYQKNIKKKHSRFNSKNQRSYSSSVFFSTRDYGAKIYHKGTEYASINGEKKKHLEANKDIRNENYRGRKISFDVESIQKFADRILRYEITYRNAYLSKMFWTKIFRRNNEEWQKKIKRFNEIKRVYDHMVAEKIAPEWREFFTNVFLGKVNIQRDRDFILQVLPDYKFIDIKFGCTRNDRAFYKWWTKQRQRRVSFMLKVPEEIRKITKGATVNLDLNLTGKGDYMLSEALFSRNLLRCCFKVFDSFRDQFEIKKQTQLSHATKVVDEHNATVKNYNDNVAPHIGTPKKKLNMSTRIRSTLLLLQTHSFEDLVKMKTMSRTNAYYLKKKFADLGINFNTGSNVKIYNCRGFHEYHLQLSSMGLEKYLRNDIFF